MKSLPVFQEGSYTVFFVASQGSVAEFPQACVECGGYMD